MTNVVLFGSGLWCLVWGTLMVALYWNKEPITAGLGVVSMVVGCVALSLFLSLQPSIPAWVFQ